jgi:hypothetical protein
MGDKTQAEHNESAHSPIADMRADIDFRRSGPKADISGAAPFVEIVCRATSRSRKRNHDPSLWFNVWKSIALKD